MQFLTPIAFLIVAALPTMVLGSSSHSPMYVFNNGVQDSVKSCSTGEWKRIQKATESAVAPPRRLGDRSLQRFCSSLWCGNFCWYYGIGCIKRSRRRQVQELSMAPNQDHRTLTSPCDPDITKINTALVRLNSTLSPSCRRLISSTHNITCLETTNECATNYVRLIASRNDTVLVERFPRSDGRFCDNIEVTFEAYTNFFEGEVGFFLYGPTTNKLKKEFESSYPYYMHGNIGMDALGGTFSAGNYTLIIKTELDPGNDQTYTFTVDDC